MGWVRLSSTMALAMLVGACASVDLPFGRQAAADVAAAPVGDAPGQIEAVHAAAVAQDQAVFWVSSNGCTQKADLTPVIRRMGEESVLTLRRIKEDRCRDRQPEGVEMRWSFEELGLAPGSRVSIENPYQLTANAG